MKVNFEQDFKENGKLKFYTNSYKIGLDIDECIADFIGGYKKTFGIKNITNWYFSYQTREILNNLKDNKDFWLGLEPKINHSELPFIPTCYISKRNFPVEWTEQWIEMHGFPCVPVLHVEDDKSEMCKNWKLDYFADDSIQNFQRLNAAGVKTFLVDGIHNKQYDVGNYRLFHLKDILEKI